MTPKHTVDQLNQGSLAIIDGSNPHVKETPFERAPDIAVFGVAHEVEVVDGYGFPVMPSDESVQATANEARKTKIARLDAEHKALNMLASENISRGRVQSLSNYANRLASGIYLEPGDEDVPIESIAKPLTKSEDAIITKCLESKSWFARSIGVMARTVTEYATDENGKRLRGKDKKTIAIRTGIVADDPTQQAQLDAGYRAFREKYFGTENKKLLDAQRDNVSSAKQSLIAQG